MNVPEPDHEATAQRLMERLSGFAQGIGMSGSEAREIIKRVTEAEARRVMRQAVKESIDGISFLSS
jgi:hypothetical protein